MTIINSFDDRTTFDILQLVRDYRAGKMGGRAGSARPIAESSKELYFVNDSGEEVPPYACMRVKRFRAFGDISYLEIAKPDETLGPISKYVFNGPAAVAINEFGRIQHGDAVRMFNVSGTTAPGRRWNPVPQQWYLALVAFGIFYELGQDNIDNNVLWVRPDVVWRCFGKSFSSIAAGSTGGMTVWTNAATSTGASISVRNPAAVAVPDSPLNLLGVSRDPATYEWIIDTEWCE